MKNIVAAVDFSNATTGVLEQASLFAKAFNARLHLFHAVEPEPRYIAYGFTPDEFPAFHAYQQEVKKRAEKHLEQLCESLKPGLSEVVCQITEGSPLYSLLDYIVEADADFVVLGSHGHGAIAALLLGSVAEGMVRKATVPTLIVPAAAE